MSFQQKLRRVSISMAVLASIEILIGFICYKLGVLRWFFAFIAICFILEVLLFSFEDFKDRKKKRGGF